MNPTADPEETAFRALVARHAGALDRVARHYEVSHAARCDLAQEILVALWRAHSSFRGDSSERTWVYRIAHNVAVSHVARAIRTRRAAAALSSVPLPDPAPAPDAVTHGRETLRRLERLIFQLDVQSQQLVLLALEGCSTTEIADVTGLSATNVTTRLSRLRKQLTEVDP